MTRLVLLLTLLTSSLVLAEAKVRQEKQAAALSEIERGFFFEARAGFWATFAPPALSSAKTYFSPGQAVEIDLGFDVGERVSIALSVTGTFNRMGSDYLGLATSQGTATGDYSAIVPGLSVKVRVVGFADAQGVSRTWLYVHLAGGAMFYSPKELIPPLGVLLSGGFGVEYFTRLRHFSIGLEGNLNVGVHPTVSPINVTAGFSILPTVKYSF